MRPLRNMRQTDWVLGLKSGFVIASLAIGLIPMLAPKLAYAQTAAAPGAGVPPRADDQCSKFNFAKPPAQPVKVRYGLTGGGEEPLALLWADKSKYPNNGKFYALEPTVFSANDRMTALQAGQIEAGSISLTALVTAVRVGLDLRAVASVVETNEIDNQGAFVVLKESPIKSAAQFKGKRIGFYGPNTISEYWIKSALRREGLKANDAQYVSMPPPAQEQALRNAQIDVAWLSRQFLARAQKTGGVEVILRPIQATQQAHPSTLVFFTQKFVAANPEAYCAWRNDYVAATRAWKLDRAALYPKLIAANYLTPGAADAGPDGGRSEDGKVHVNNVQQTITDMVESGFLPSARAVPAEGLLMKGYALQH
jgi:ABC-type nitrate/sulfonate/bicarbonate transport system substrate-binding protein